MVAGGAPDIDRITDLDSFVTELGCLVAQRGMSLRELASAAGPLMKPPQKLARSTIQDLLAPGRKRLNLHLVVAVVRALGVGEAAVEAWHTACIRAHRGVDPGRPAGVLRQLPADQPTFTGRDDVVRTLIKAATVRPDAQAGRAATIVVSAIEGMGGVGKTQLVLHVAHELIRSGQYADVQLFANLRGFDPEHQPADPAEVLDGFLRQLKVPARDIPATLDERAAMFRDRLHDRRALIVLDNAFDAQQVCDLIPASPLCLVLITSRRSLGGLDGVSPYLLDVFSQTEAVELLRRIVGEHRVDAEPEAAALVVAACGYLPLAVALVAARLRSRPAWTVGDLAGRLRAGNLDEVRAADRGLRDVFDLSYQGLDEATRRVFRLLGLFPGASFTSPAVAAMSELATADAENLLQHLVDENLLQQSSADRYEMHDLVRSYARDLAQHESEDQRTAVLVRLTTWFLHTVQQAGTAMAKKDRPIELPDPVGVEPLRFDSYNSALTWLDSERENLTVSVQTAFDHGLYEIAWKTTASLRSFHLLRHCLDDSIRCYDIALRAARTLADQPAQARVLNGLSGVHRHRGEAQKSAEAARRAVDLYSRLQDPVGHSIALNNLAVALTQLDRNEEALVIYGQAIAISSAAGDALNEGIALLNAVESYGHLGRRQEAIDAGRRARPILRQAEHRQAEAILLDTIAQIHHRAGYLEEAITAYRECEEIAAEIGYLYLQAGVLRGLGDAHEALGQSAEAREAWSQALSLFETLDDPEASELRVRLAQAGSAPERDSGCRVV